MAGKNTAVFGIYRTRAGVERAVDELRSTGFRNTDISVLFPENVGTKDFAHEKHTKAVRERERSWAERWDGWPVLVPWPFLGWGLLLQPDRSWRRWPGSVWAAP